MGEVHAAVDVRLDREVAIKLVPAAGINPVTRARFVREARAAARINHPNAVAVYDAGESDGFLYLVMERVTGGTLADRLTETGPMPVSEASAVALAVLAGLGAAHSAGVVHRDVKPANVIVGPGGVKLVDFGIATLVGEAGSGVTVAGDVVGTPKYLAPEQIAGQLATPATDLYAVGVVLFEMLTGVAPFDRSTPVATALAHRDEAPPDVRTLRPDASPRVAAVISTALQKRPADRYRSAAEMGRALTPAAAADYSGDTAVLTAAPVPTRSRASGRGWWLAAAAVLVAGGAAVIALVQNGDDSPTSATSASTGAAATTLVNTPTTLAATTLAPTTLAPTTVASTTIAGAADPPAPSSVEQLITVLAADPARYGPRTGEVIDRLGEIDNRGRKSRERATELLDNAYVWAGGGELTAEAIVLLEPVLSPLAEDGDDGDEDD
jgi:serine/threonine-protein kinase